MNIQVAIDTLVAHAQERYEDSIVCDSARQFVTYIGNVPQQGFGNLPWSAQWMTDWATARDARFTEATTMRDVLASTAGGLYQVAADYTDADVTSAAELDVQVTNLLPFLPAGPAQPHTYHPGDEDYTPPGSNVDPKFAPNVSNNETLKWISLSNQVGVVRVEAPGQVSDADLAEEHYGDSEGRKALNDFVMQWESKLVEIENVVETISPGIGKPMQNEIITAWKCWPKVLWERADTFHSLAQCYREMRDEYAGEVNVLKGYWDSPGAATAYYNHAGVILSYFDTLEAEAKWLAEEGKKCANVIDKLQLAYANLGYEHIQNILNHYQDYLDDLGSLTSSSNPAEALANAFNAFASSIIGQQNTAASEAQDRLQLSQTVVDNQPDLGTAGHAAEVFPQVQGGDSWKDGDSWVP